MRSRTLSDIGQHSRSHIVIDDDPCSLFADIIVEGTSDHSQFMQPRRQDGTSAFAATTMCSPPISSKERKHWLTDLYLTVGCLVCVPMYSMLLWLGVMALVLFYCPGLPRYAVLAYFGYLAIDRTPQKGGLNLSGRERLRRFVGFRLVARYFPVHLHKTTELRGDNQAYLFLYHPHGVIAMGSNTALATNGCDFDSVFPTIRRRWAVTLNASFLAPIFRDWMLALGFLSANKETLKSKLQQGDSVVLVPGGAAEALHAHPGVMKLQLKGRYGFVKLALETGAQLIPVLGLGENDIFETLYDSDSIVAKMQRKLGKIMTFTLPILTWPIPRRRPIHVIVGKPLVFLSKDVEECHAQYLQHLQALYDQHKGKYGFQDVPLEFV